MREAGCLADDPYPLRANLEFPNEQLVMGAKVFRRQCAVCHTMEGTNALAHLTSSWDLVQMRMNIAKLQHTKPFMPPFAGTAKELESLVQYIDWSNNGRLATWSESHNRETLARIQQWLDEAGTQPGNIAQYRESVREQE